MMHPPTPSQSETTLSHVPTFDTGAEFVVDAYGCNEFSLTHLETVRAVCERLVVDLELRVLGEPHWHQFPEPGGVTGLYLLSESHLACHTYPENGFASFNLYCCRPRSDWPWQDVLSEALGATNVEVRVLPRGRKDNSAPGGQA